MRISALVLNWNRSQETIRCLTSIQRYAPEIDVLVVDNASEDDSVAQIQAAFPDVDLLRNETNAGYAGGNNAGFKALMARERTPDAILVLNNDVEILPGCVQALVQAAQNDPARGLIAPISRMRSDPEMLDFHRARIDLPNLAVNALGREQRRIPTEDVDSDYVPGSAFLISAQALQVLGGFHAPYYLVWEDVDLSLRAVKEGFGKARMVASAQVLHEGSVSFGGSATPVYQYFYVRNSYLLIQRHLKLMQRWRTRRLLDRRYAGWVAKAPDPAIAKAISKGIEDGHAGRFGPTPIDLVNP